MNSKLFDDFAAEVSRKLPAGFDALGKDIERNVRLALERLLAKMDLVTREEFDVQRDLAARLHERITQLEARVTALEAGELAGGAHKPNT